MHQYGTHSSLYSRRVSSTSMDTLEDGEPWASQVYVPAVLSSREVKRVRLETTPVDNTWYCLWSNLSLSGEPECFHVTLKSPSWLGTRRGKHDNVTSFPGYTVAEGGVACNSRGITVKWELKETVMHNQITVPIANKLVSNLCHKVEVYGQLLQYILHHTSCLRTTWRAWLLSLIPVCSITLQETIHSRLATGANGSIDCLGCPHIGVTPSTDEHKHKEQEADTYITMRKLSVYCMELPNAYPGKPRVADTHCTHWPLT